MYLYLLQDSANIFIGVGIAPSSRGRAPKNHHEHNFVTDSGVEFNGYFGVLPEAVYADTNTAAEFKQAIVDGLGVARPAIHPNRLTLTWATAIHAAIVNMLGRPEIESAVPTSVKHQLTAVNDALSKILVRHHSGDLTKEDLSELCEIIANNKKVINVALGALNATWSLKEGVVAEDSAKPKKKIEKEEGDTKTGEASIPTPSAFGFERLSGEKPELKVVDPAAQAADTHGVFAPKPDNTYIINEGTENLFNILQVSRKQAPQNVNLVGPHGCGKTELAIQYAARAGSPMLIMDCANLREARDWFGYKTAREGTVYWHESQFVRAVEAGGHVILLDELNRANPHILNTLMPLLDARRFTFLEEKGDKICVGPGTVFFATMNEGAGYTGTTPLDRALRDRFPRRLELTYLSEKDEIKLLVNRIGIEKEIATLLVQMANKIRQDATGLAATLTESVSTRQLLAAAYDFMIGGVETLQLTVSNHFSPDGDDDSERVKVQNIIQGKFGHLLAAKAEKKKGA